MFLFYFIFFAILVESKTTTGNSRTSFLLDLVCDGWSAVFLIWLAVCVIWNIYLVLSINKTVLAWLKFFFSFFSQRSSRFCETELCVWSLWKRWRVSKTPGRLSASKEAREDDSVTYSSPDTLQDLTWWNFNYCDKYTFLHTCFFLWVIVISDINDWTTIIVI